MKEQTYPTQWQKKVLWGTLTAAAITAIGLLGAFLIVGAGRILGFLQPLLIPVAVAGILAYLLNPIVEWLARRGTTRTRAVVGVFALVLLPLTLGVLWIVPQIYEQSVDFAKYLPELITKARAVEIASVKQYQLRYADNPYVQDIIQQATEWGQHQLPALPARVWAFVTGGVQGFMGAFGILLGLVIVPVYLFFFLANAGSISRRWSDYLPIRASPFKDEVVDCLNEINKYLIAFFRGQVLVSMIDGAILGVALLFMGLKFALLIGLMVAILQLVPYLGVLVCWAPAVLIAAVQYHDWQHVIWVTVIFFIVTHLDSIFIAPRIVGTSVGLHPMTIILSVFAWSLLIGGLLGALLAVPLTATLKVLLRRYVWQRRFSAKAQQRPAPDETPH